ncbi:MBL fold metallo-hydrolase [Streptomyces sp. NPDC048680]|uniref:MBL fold metallo-hydrolase n=1 Tax=Streptomyces sp. NPDC048680 TaxID=3155492 RepID=UPI00343E5AC6
MRLTFLGHQSWLVENKNTAILVDPVLDQKFGHSAELPFRIWPPRKIDTDRMPQPQAVFLSHEHLDHFHVPSLDMLPRSVQFYTGDITPLPVVETIRKLGFTCHRIPPTESVTIGDLTVTVYPAGRETISWEKRVFQLVFSEAGVAGNDVYIPVDALASAEYAADIASGRRQAPRAAVIANNGQVVPPGALGAYTNLLPVPTVKRSEMTALELIDQLANAAQLEGLPHIEEIMVCGGGFVGPYSPHGPFQFADHHWLASRINELQNSRRFYGPWPGETLVLEPGAPISWDQVPWVHLDEEEQRRGYAKLEAYLAEPKVQRIRPVMDRFDDDAEANEALQEVEEALVPLARELLQTAVGQAASSIHRFLDGRLGPQRCLLMLLDGPGGTTHAYAWDIAAMAFVPVGDIGLGTALRRYPYGIQCYFRDFVAVIRGEQQIWDLAGTAMQSWYLGDSYSTMVTAFYELFGEQARPDLAARVYDRALAAHLASKEAQRAGTSEQPEKEATVL